MDERPPGTQTPHTIAPRHPPSHDGKRRSQERQEVTMDVLKQFGEIYRKWKRPPVPPEICEVCGGELEMDAESGEGHCPVCESMEE